MTEIEYKIVVKLMIEKLERLKDEIAEKDMYIDILEKRLVLVDKFQHEVKAEAIKEFAGRLKEKYSQADILCPRRIISLTEKELDDLVKEMVGGTE